MNSQHVAPGLVKPGYDNDFVPSGYAVEPLCYRRFHFEPGVRRSFQTLFRRFRTRLKGRSDNPDGIGAERSSDELSRFAF